MGVGPPSPNGRLLFFLMLGKGILNGDPDTTSLATYSHLNSEEGPYKGPRPRPEPHPIPPNGSNPHRRSHNWAEFQIGVQKVENKTK